MVLSKRIRERTFDVIVTLVKRCDDVHWKVWAKDEDIVIKEIVYHLSAFLKND